MHFRLFNPIEVYKIESSGPPLPWYADHPPLVSMSSIMAQSLVSRLLISASAGKPLYPGLKRWPIHKKK